MAASSRIIDYLGEGSHAARPAAPTLMAGGIGLYYETDTTTLFMWDVAGAAWVQISDSGGVPGTVTEVVGGTGLAGGTITATGTLSLAAIASHDVLANATGSSAAPSATTVTALLDAALGSTQGDILFRNATTWTVLAPGTSGQVLSTGGTAGNPSWAAGGGSGTVTEVDTGAGLTGGPITTTGTVSVGTTAITNTMLAGSITAAKLVGTDIATVGTITAGVWNGTAVDLTHGGTGADLHTTGPGVVTQGTSGAALGITSMTNGQLLIGSTGSIASAGTITAGTGISIGVGAGSTTVTNTGVTSIIAGTGLSGGTITSTGTVSMTNTSMTIAGHSVSLGGTQALASTDLSDTAALAYLANNQSFTKGQAVTPGTIASGATISVDASLACDFTGTVTQSFTLANPTNLKAGQTLNFWITQDGTGGRTITLGTQYQAAGGSSSIVLSTAAGAKDLLTCRADTTTTLTCALIKAISH